MNKNRAYKCSIWFILIILMVFQLFLNIPDISAQNEKSTVCKELIVKYKDAKDHLDVIKYIKENFSEKIEKIDLSKKNNMLFIKYYESFYINDLKTILESSKNIEYVQEDYIISPSTISNPHFDKQWALKNNGQNIMGLDGQIDIDINIESAWNISSGSSEVIVGILDTGIDIFHPELKNRIYCNSKEIANNSIDDDNNGYVDDVNGWNFVNDDNDVLYKNTMEKHGTLVSGIIAAEDNFEGICGVAPQVKILPLKVIDGDVGRTSNLIRAIDYAKTLGVKIINCSFVCSKYNAALQEAMYNSDILFVCASGNNALNLDEMHMYPSCFDLDNIISVAALNSVGQIATFSNYGSQVDIAAPGTNIYSTSTLEGYEYVSGTSVSTAFITGVAALVLSTDIDLSSLQLKNRIIQNACKLETLTDKVLSNGIVDAYASISNTSPQPKDSTYISITDDCCYNNLIETKLCKEDSEFVELISDEDAESEEPYVETYISQNDVDVANGVLRMTFKDMTLSGYTPELSIQRFYVSKPTKWSFNINNKAKKYYEYSKKYSYEVLLPNGSNISFKYNAKLDGNKIYSIEPQNYFTAITDDDGDIYITVKEGFTYVYTIDNGMKYLPLTKIVDLKGNELIMDYTTDYVLKGITDYKGNYYSIVYDNGNISTIKNNSTHQQINYQYDDEKIVVNSGDNTTTYYTDKLKGKIIKIENKLGEVLEEYTYYPEEWIYIIEDTKIRYESDYGNCIKSIKNEQGIITEYDYETVEKDMNWFLYEKPITVNTTETTFNVVNGQVVMESKPITMIVGYEKYYKRGKVNVINKTIETKTYSNNDQIVNIYNSDFEIESNKDFVGGVKSDIYPYYIVNRRIVTVTDNAHRSLFYDYHTDNRTLKTATDIFGNITQYLDLTSLGNYRIVVKPNGGEHLYDYDEQQNLIFEQDENGNATIYIHTYDGEYLTKTDVVEVLDNTIWTQDTENGLLPVKNELGQPIISDYSKNKCSVTTYEYSTEEIRGLLVRTTSPEGHVTEYTYNSFGELESVHSVDAGNNPQELKTTYTYEVIYENPETGEVREANYGSAINDGEYYAGIKITKTSPEGYVTIQYFNEKGLIEKVSEYGTPGNISTTKYVYNDNDNIIQQFNPNEYVNTNFDDTDSISQNATCYEYYLNTDLVKKTSDPEGNVTEYEYNIFNKKSKEITPTGAIYRYVYDNVGELKETHYQENAESVEVLLEEYVVGEDGCVSEIRDTAEKLNSDNLTNEYSIDEGSKVIKTLRKYYETNTDGSTDTSKYLETKYVFDYAGNLVKKLNADGTVATKTYHKNGLLASEKDETGYVTYYEYDNLCRLSDKWLPLEINESGSTLYTYTKYIYDAESRLLHEITDKTSVIYPNKLDYTSVESLAAERYFIKSSTYYIDGNLATESINEGAFKEFHYDCDNNLVKEITKVNEKESNVVEYSYETNKRAQKPDKKIIWVNKKDIYGYQNDSDGSVAIITEYLYDKNGNIVCETVNELNADSVDYAQIKHIYNYDKLNRVIYEGIEGIDDNGDVIEKTLQKGYDYRNNIIWEIDAKNYHYFENALRTIYTYNGLGHLIKQEKQGRNESKITLFDYDLLGRKIAEVSPKNYNNSLDIGSMNRKVYTYDDMNRVLTEGVIYDGLIFDEESETLVTSSINNITAAFMYDSAGNVIKKLSAEEYAAAEGVDVFEKITNGHGKEYKYNAQGFVTFEKIPDALNAEEQIYSYTYDVFNFKTSDVVNGIIARTYINNSYGSVLQTLLSDGTVIEENTYDYTGNLIMHKDSNGNVTEYIYNAFNKPREVTIYGDESIDEQKIIYQYDILGRENSRKDNTGTENIMIYDAFGNIISETVSKDNESITKTFKYDLNNNLVSKTDGNGNVIKYTYDDFSREIENTSYALDLCGDIYNKETWHIYINGTNYDLDDNILSKTTVIENRGHSYEATARYTYDPLNRLIQKTNENGVIVEILQYDLNSSQIYSYAPVYDDDLERYVYAKKEFVYNLNNQLIKTIDEIGNCVEQTYDNQGNILTKNDGNSILQYNYDIHNRLIEVYAKNGNVYEKQSEYIYDNNDNMIAQINGKGDTTKYLYNTHNKISEVIYPGEEDTSSEKYAYYADGLIKASTDRNGVITSYTYNAIGKILSKSAGEIINTYQYDKNGNMLVSDNGHEQIVRKYDGFNRVILKTESSMTIEYQYDKFADEGILDETLFAGGIYVDKHYDKAGQLLQVYGNTDSQFASYEYYNNGTLKTITYSTGMFTEYKYYKNNTIKSITNIFEDMEYYCFNYEYDCAGNQIKETIIYIDGSVEESNYEYDYLNRLVKVSEPYGKITTYTYDLAGNRIQETVTIDELTVTKMYQYNSQQWLEKSTTTSDYGNKTTLYRYDNNGNIISKENQYYATRFNDDSSMELYLLGERDLYDEIIYMYDYDMYDCKMDYNETYNSLITLYEYDSFNRLTKVTSDATIVENTYNAENMRATKSVNNENKVHYIYDGKNILAELDDSGFLKAVNLYGLNIVARGILPPYPSCYYYVHNAHGDVKGLYDARSGYLIRGYHYGPFGEKRNADDSLDSPYGYAGYFYDAETMLYYCNARFYDPEIGRFINQDTVIGDVHNPLSLNRYTYCFNNPLMYDDPSGNWPKFIQNLANAAVENIIKPTIENIKSLANSTTQFVSQNKSAFVAGVAGISMMTAGVALLGISGGTSSTLVAAGASTFASAATTTLGAAMIGGGFDMTYTVMRDYFEDRNFNYSAKQYTASAIRGSVTGALGGVGNSAMNSLVKESVWTGISGAYGDMAVQMYENGKIDYKQSAMYGLKAGIGSFVFGATTSTLINTFPQSKSGEFNDRLVIDDTIYNIDITYSPVNPHPNLSPNIQNSFSGGTFTQKTLQNDEIFYRVYGGSADKVGSYMSRTYQMGHLQSQIDLALNPTWGNTARYMTKVVVPKGTVIYEGTASPQIINYGVGKFIGGGNQVFIPREVLNSKWFK